MDCPIACLAGDGWRDGPVRSCRQKRYLFSPVVNFDPAVTGWLWPGQWKSTTVNRALDQ